ncbi:MAG: zinc ribbon domain-containing protein [Deltaproteobacteria bacterium]|nr:zinc ribbon domain-containing protein [Deltaproteobacteria bacterium]
MPIYEYSCNKCKKSFEIFQKITEKPRKVCEKCGGKLEKVVSHSAFHLKGTGWYKTTASPNSSSKDQGCAKPGCKATASATKKETKTCSSSATS